MRLHRARYAFGEEMRSSTWTHAPHRIALAKVCGWRCVVVMDDNIKPPRMGSRRHRQLQIAAKATMRERLSRACAIAWQQMRLRRARCAFGAGMRGSAPARRARRPFPHGLPALSGGPIEQRYLDHWPVRRLWRAVRRHIHVPGLLSPTSCRLDPPDPPRAWCTARFVLALLKRVG